jgi:hypothetical protein
MTSLASASVTRCPICDKPVQADSAGFLECPCGWGGPDDPVESARGISRAITLLDRRWASSIAWRDLRRIAERKGPTSPRNPLYLLALLALSTLVYLTLVALVVVLGILLVYYVQHGFWVGVVLAGAILFYLYYAIFGFPDRSRTLVAPLASYPRLEALTREVAAQVKVKAPRWVIFFNEANFFIGRKMLWGKALLPQTVLGIGVPGLTLLSEQELRVILTRELAHDHYDHTLGVVYFGLAERALYRIINAAHQGTATQAPNQGRVRVRYRGIGAGSITNLGLMLGIIVIWIVTLPLRLLWVIFHMLRLRISRSHEFQADAAVIRLYGTQEYVNAQTGMLAVTRTLRGASQSLRREMARHNNSNFYAELRRHYAELPQDYLGEMRLKAVRGYRTLQSMHPIMPDRIRSALIQAVSAPAPATGEAEPAWRAITPVGADSPDAFEIELTKRFQR